MSATDSMRHPAATRFRATALFACGAVIALMGSGQVANAQQRSKQPPKAAAAAPAQDYSKAEVHILPVQGRTYMLVGAGGNITVQVGDDGVFVVDTGVVQMSDKVLAAIRSLTDKPIRYVVNTHVHADHTGGNAAISKAGATIAGGNVVSDIGASATNQAKVYAHQNVLDRMSTPEGNEPPAATDSLPTDTYTTPEWKLFFNGEGIELIHQPAAHTDGDTMVFFRRSDVISTGDIFVTNRYPIIDMPRGGTIQGELDALNRIIAIAIPADLQEDGTLIVPGHGRLCDVADVAFYQEMVTIIRDRIKNMRDKGMTLEQVKAAKPTRDYDARYGATSGFWTTDMFVEAVYKTLSAKQ